MFVRVFVFLASPDQTLKRISKDLSPEADFKARGVTKAELPGRYPYRDNGLKYWEATHTWVKDYLDVSLRWSASYMINFSRDGGIAFIDGGGGGDDVLIL